MNCWHCKHELVWGGDLDIGGDDDDCEEYQMETNLTCPMCGSLHLVYLPKEQEEWVGEAYEDG